MNDAVPLQKLEEMKCYYQSSASEFDEVFNRQGRYDQGPELNARWFAEWDEMFALLHAFAAQRLDHYRRRCFCRNAGDQPGQSRQSSRYLCPG